MRLHLSLNPVMVKEMRGRMRGPRAYLFLAATLALLGVVTYGLYRLVRFTASVPGGIPSSAVIGSSLFTGLVLLATIVICAIAPSLTAGAISGEHERKTFDLLMATPLDTSSILIGKLIASMSYVALILLAIVPMVSLAFVFGGVSIADMFTSLLLLLVFALTFSVMGLFFSALFRRTGLAVGASYVVLALFVFGTMFAYAVFGVARGQLPPSWILVLNPFSAMSSALVQTPTPGLFSFGGFVSVLTGLMGGMGFDQRTAQSRPLWQMTVGAYLWLSVVLYWVTAQLVKPVRRFQPRRRAVALAGLILIVSIAAPFVLYGPLSPDSLAAWVQWMNSAPQNLVQNGQFAESLDRWQTSSYLERSDEKEGMVTVASDGDRRVARLARTGKNQSVTSITQTISQTVNAGGWLQLRAQVRAKSAAPGSCGSEGNACPLMIKLVFLATDGSVHEWMQGFQTVDGQLSGAPPFCVNCEFRQNHVQLNPGEWHTFESPNLFTTPLFQKAAAIRSMTVSAAGQSYEVEIAQVALLAHQGRPIDWSDIGGSNTPTPVFLRGIGKGGMIVPVAPLIAPPPPVQAVPVPIPAPTATPAPTPTPTPFKQ